MIAPDLQPGDVVYLDYGEVHVIHTRLITGVVDRTTHEFFTFTPDLDHYIEVLHQSNADLVGCQYAPPGGWYPPGRVAALFLYAFAPMTAAELARRLQDGRRAADQERLHRGLPAVAVPGVVPAAAVGAQPDQAVWVLCTMVEVHNIGERIQIADSAGSCRQPWSTQKCWAPFAIDAHMQMARISEAIDGDDRVAAHNIRTMSVKYSVNGERQRSIRERVGEMVQVEMDDFPYHPRATLESLKGVQSISESNYAQHLAWVQQSKIPDGS